MSRFVLFLAVAAGLAAAPFALAAGRAQGESPRAAILVGASAPVPGRVLLRHAHRDAETMAGVLAAVGGFARDRVHVLRDPEPAALVALVEREAAALAGLPQAMLFFYYSGHAGDGALFTAGKPLAVEVLRRVLDRSDVSVRIGVVDACQGGDWTRAKGLVPDAPFEVALPPVLASEGSALIASSSGSESAHESDALGGSFFTHHFAAGLRGAAGGRDGEVTLTEAFEYAREQTIRETARLAREPQHPSFALNLKGRQDLVLAQVATSPSSLAVEQAEGPLEVVHLGSGLRMVELPPGAREVVLAVPPGRYLVRKLGGAGVQAREIAVPRDGEARVREGELVLVGSERLAVKGERGEGLLPRRWGWEVELGVAAGFEVGRGLAEIESLSFGTGGPAHETVRFDGRLGITDRLAWRIGTLAFAYGFGGDGGPEMVPYGGVLEWATIPGVGTRTSIGGGVGGRLPLGPAAVVGSAAVERPYGLQAPNAPDYVARAAVGLGVRLGKVVSLHLAAGLSSSSFPEYEEPQVPRIRFPARHDTAWSVGSIQELGLAQLPLVALHAPRGWSLNLYAASETTYHDNRNPVTTSWARAGISKRF